MSTTPALSPAQLQRYFARIGYSGPTSVSLPTLRGLHRAHLLAIPYENLDIHLGLPITLDPEAMFNKLVDERRGGWCFEMNGVFGRVLETLGFQVRYLSGAVNRATHGWRAQGNHLVLLVTLERAWLADVGFGDGFVTPLPLEPGSYRQDYLQYRVSRDGPRWRVDNHQYGGADGFDFTLTPRTLEAFGSQCHSLQTDPASSFVTTLVCERVVPEGLVILRSATLRTVTVDGATDRVLQSAAEFVDVLERRFDLHLAEAASLWPIALRQHEAFLAARATPLAR